MPSSPTSARTSSARAHGLGRDLCRPEPIAAALVLLVNDHVLKSALGTGPGAWSLVTGKLSDFAGLFLFPILLTTALRALFPGGRRSSAGPRMWPISVAATATAMAFCALKLSPPFNRAVADLWGANVMDATDLVALPMVAAGWLWLAARERGRYRRRGAPYGRNTPTYAQVFAVTLAAFASLATSPARWTRNYPSWAIEQKPLVAGCARLEPFVSKSGKTGVGLSIAVEAAGGGSCEVAIAGATLSLSRADDKPVPPYLLDNLKIRARAQGSPATAAGRATEYIYLPFLFDNNDMWNRHIRNGVFEIEVVVAGRAQPIWRIAGEHRLGGYHGNRFDDRHDPPAAPPRRIQSIAE